MALIILEGLDRTGKSSVAKDFQAKGYELIHMSAPSKELSEPGYTGPSYLDQIIELVAGAANKDIVLDRSHYGELIWPQIYGREPMLNDEDIEIIREIEDSVGTTRILMNDPDVEAHWARCVANKEPLTRAQFLRARNLFERMGTKYKFDKKTLPEISANFIQTDPSPKHDPTQVTTTTNTDNSTTVITYTQASSTKKPTEMEKLEKANAINDVLSKRIIKAKGGIYDELETDVRNYLSKRLGEIFGQSSDDSLSPDEVQLLKLVCKRMKDKESKQ